MFCLHSHNPRWTSTASQPRQTDWQNSREVRIAESCPISLSYIITQIMRFSFLVIIAALTASMFVSACHMYDENCDNNGDCCSDLYCDNLYCKFPNVTA
ncbi:hypothetical protein K503DRAFT_774993 [Rhizopogon vinicolor AM-OR11-026]|uniref:Uncharacterized protein n=1 Tax=Rhizopogon vinicolor AM-OR11-026 TaxID=1314800 RepID=A0A1B7MN67_9AGAM|nr:hypothetical protein K503DRAFT_774993 [Rhizopogon vinicolor AM-OR11-026]